MNQAKDSDLVQFYQHVISPPMPFFVSKVVLDASAQRVDVWLEHEAGVRFACPACGELCSVFDHAPERCWRHLDTCTCSTFIHARIPRVKCKNHGVHNILFPLSEPNSSITYELECKCIKVMQHCTIYASSQLLDVSQDSLRYIQTRAVQRGMKRREDVLPRKLGIDEKQVFARHRYFTIIYDLEKGIVIDTIENRSIRAVTPWFEKQGKKLNDVNLVAMDMNAGYWKVVSKWMPNALICFDRFHAQQKVQIAVDATRREEQKNGGKEMKERMFRNRFLFLWNKENIPEERRKDFEQLRGIALKTSRAWAIKENFKGFWKEAQYVAGKPEEYFRKWFWWATHSRLKHISMAAHTLKRHFDGVLAAAKERIGNAVAEGLNNKIETLKRCACGFKNKDFFRSAILFRCGGLDLLPFKNCHCNFARV